MGIIQIDNVSYWRDLEYGKEYFLGYLDNKTLTGYYFGINLGHYIFYNIIKSKYIGYDHRGDIDDIKGFSSRITEPVRFISDGSKGFYFNFFSITSDLEKKLILETLNRMKTRNNLEN